MNHKIIDQLVILSCYNNSSNSLATTLHTSVITSSHTQQQNQHNKINNNKNNKCQAAPLTLLQIKVLRQCNHHGNIINNLNNSNIKKENESKKKTCKMNIEMRRSVTCMLCEGGAGGAG